ncbi:MAG: NAD(P)H-binding protein [Terriglobales bacterium]
MTTATTSADATAQYSAIVLGATGNVGGRIVQLLIRSPLCKKVVVVTRRKADAFSDPKVSEVVVNMDRLEEEVAPHAQGVDVALAAFGVGKGSAKMPEEELRKIEIAYPLAFCRAARAGGARVCGVMTAAGADPEAGMKYAKIIGEKEKAVESVKFDFLGVYRPAVILGNSNTPGSLGCVMPLLHWAMPSRYHSIHKNDLARAMVAQSEQAFLALPQDNASNDKEATVKILEYKEMEPFFVKGESDEP